MSVDCIYIFQLSQWLSQFLNVHADTFGRHKRDQSIISSLFRQKACKVSKEDDVMSIITIADILVNAPIEVVSIVITEDDE